MKIGRKPNLFLGIIISVIVVIFAMVAWHRYRLAREDRYIEKLQSRDAEVRRGAAVRLSEIGSSRSVPDLKRALLDNDRKLRVEASRALHSLSVETDSFPRFVPEPQMLEKVVDITEGRVRMRDLVDLLQDQAGLEVNLNLNQGVLDLWVSVEERAKADVTEIIAILQAQGVEVSRRGDVLVVATSSARGDMGHEAKDALESLQKESRNSDNRNVKTVTLSTLRRRLSGLRKGMPMIDVMKTHGLSPKSGGGEADGGWTWHYRIDADHKLSVSYDSEKQLETVLLAGPHGTIERWPGPIQ